MHVHVFIINFSAHSAPPPPSNGFVHHYQDDILLEVQIQNLTVSAMYLEVVNFEPTAGLTVLDLNKVEGREEDEEE